MFENLVLLYYATEEIDQALVKQIAESRHRAEAFMACNEKRTLEDTHSFHDWYLTECGVYCEPDIKKCRIVLKHGSEVYQILLAEVSSFSAYGELVSDKANYPETYGKPPLAQVLDLWIDYRDGFEFCLLFDNERYIIIRSKCLQIQK